VNNVDVYPLLCELVKVECHPHNGTLDHFAEAMRNTSYFNTLLSRQV
jgi:hypothetical protein